MDIVIQSHLRFSFFKLQGFVLTQADYDGRTALHVAACEGHLEVVKYLLEHGASVHLRDRFGHSPLDDAVRFGHEEVVEILVNTGAHLSMPSSKMGMMLCKYVCFHTTMSL